MQYDPIVIPRAGLKSAARQTKCRRRAVSPGERGSGRTEGEFGGPAEETGARGRVAAVRAAPAGSSTPAGPCALRSRPRFVRAFPGLPAPLPRWLRAADSRPGCTRAARQRLAGVSPASPRRLSCPGQGNAEGSLASHGRAARGGAAAGARASRARRPRQCIGGALNRTRAASARVAGGKGCPVGSGFTSSRLLLGHTAKPKWRVRVLRGS